MKKKLALGGAFSELKNVNFFKGLSHIDEVQYINITDLAGVAVV
ncbi:MAG: hypothetical protein ACYDEQ_03365 [Desulfocucumaceae bacterium]